MNAVLATVQRLRDQGRAVDALVSGLAEEEWATPTPAPGWTIAHQVGHLLWSDEAAMDALAGREVFAAQLRRAMADPTGAIDELAAERAALAPADLLGRWREGRERLADGLEAAPADTRLPWFGPDMGLRSMATARLMETWAHGQDIADALGARLDDGDSLRDIADLGVRTRDFAHVNSGLPVPSTEFRIELEAPDGAVWRWGPEDVDQRLSGPARDFCLLVTQRRELGDLALVAEGDEVTRWLEVAQVFAGPPKSVVRGRRTV